MCWLRNKHRKRLNEIDNEVKAKIEIINASTEYENELLRIADALRTVVRAAQDSEQLCLVTKSGKPEEETKRTLIFPFISALGYDVYDERVLAGERKILCRDPITDNETEKKVDYSMVPMNVQPLLPQEYSTILLEAKAHTVGLNGVKPGSPWHQLAEYFENAPEAELAILTNGKEYRFYGCDPESAVTKTMGKKDDRKMSADPFLAFDLSTLSADGNDVYELANKLLYMGFKQFDMTQVDEYTATIKPFMKKKIKDTGYPQELISAIRKVVGNTDMINDETLVSWFKETVVQ